MENYKEHEFKIICFTEKDIYIIAGNSFNGETISNDEEIHMG